MRKLYISLFYPFYMTVLIVAKCFLPLCGQAPWSKDPSGQRANTAISLYSGPNPESVTFGGAANAVSEPLRAPPGASPTLTLFFVNLPVSEHSHLHPR